MSAQTFDCPSCGAKLELENRFSKVIVCAYCDQTSYVDTGGLSLQGKSAKLIDTFSILSVGAKGILQGKNFKVLGRLRYEYQAGFWDEWFVELENEGFRWLQEDEGNFTLYEKGELKGEIYDVEQVLIGRTLVIGDLQVFVTEKTEATILGGEGELFFRVLPGETVTCIDGNSRGTQVAIEITPHEIELCTGKVISIDEIVLEEEL